MSRNGQKQRTIILSLTFVDILGLFLFFAAKRANAIPGYFNSRNGQKNHIDVLKFDIYYWLNGNTDITNVRKIPDIPFDITQFEYHAWTFQLKKWSKESQR